MPCRRSGSRTARSSYIPARASPRYSAAAQTTLAAAPVLGFTPNAYGVEDNAADTSGNPGSSGIGASSYSLGFAFTADTASFVTSLGYFNDHQVGLYQVVPGAAVTPESGLLLGQTTITLASTARGDFLYNAITPIALLPGTEYVLAGVSGPQDPFIYNVEDDTRSDFTGLTVDPAVTYNQSRYAVSDTLTHAGSYDGSEPGFFGPNFQISSTLAASAAPEPGQWSVLALVTASLSTLIVRVRRRTATAK